MGALPFNALDKTTRQHARVRVTHRLQLALHGLHMGPASLCKQEESAGRFEAGRGMIKLPMNEGSAGWHRTRTLLDLA